MIDIDGPDVSCETVEHANIEKCVLLSDFEIAAKEVQPAAKREGFSTVPDVCWDAVGSLKDLKEELEQWVCRPVRQPELFAKMGIKPEAGVLLFGPPGCGKTLVAKAVANASNANFISVKGPELLSKYVGESERAVRQVFQRAATSAPCIVFFDELDSLCPTRSGEGNQASERVVNQLLTEMDGMNSRKGVFVIGASNRPDTIDGAMLRPGRLGKLVYVPLPDHAGRVDILSTCLKGKPLDPAVDLNALAARVPRFSGADLAHLCHEAAMHVINRGGDVIQDVDFDSALTKCKPSVSELDESRYDKMRQTFSSTVLSK
jgi:ribosome biogenesis ATPase